MTRRELVAQLRHAVGVDLSVQGRLKPREGAGREQAARGEGRNSSRSQCACEGHRFESPLRRPFTQEGSQVRSLYPPPGSPHKPRLFSRLRISTIFPQLAARETGLCCRPGEYRADFWRVWPEVSGRRISFPKLLFRHIPRSSLARASSDQWRSIGSPAG